MMMKRLLLGLIPLVVPLHAHAQAAPPGDGGNAECQPVIDAHLHFYTPESFWGPAPFFPMPNNPMSGEPGARTQEEHVETTLQEMEENCVVLALASAPLDWQNPAPDRLWHSLEVVNEDPETVNLELLTAAVEEGRIRAIGELGPEYQGISPADPRWEPIYELAEEHGLPVGVHTGGGPPGAALGNNPKFRYEYGNPLLLQDVLVRHPKLKVTMMHAGLALYAPEALAMMHMYPNLFVDIGAATWVAPFMKVALEDFLKQAIFRGYGDRILFGTDQMVWPSTISLAVETIQDASYLTEEQKRDILYNNSARFLGLSEEEIAQHLGSGDGSRDSPSNPSS